MPTISSAPDDPDKTTTPASKAFFGSLFAAAVAAGAIFLGKRFVSDDEED